MASGISTAQVPPRARSGPASGFAPRIGLHESLRHREPRGSISANRNTSRWVRHLELTRPTSKASDGCRLDLHALTRSRCNLNEFDNIYITVEVVSRSREIVEVNPAPIRGFRCRLCELQMSEPPGGDPIRRYGGWQLSTAQAASEGLIRPGREPGTAEKQPPREPARDVSPDVFSALVEAKTRR